MNKSIAIGADIGGSHITCAAVDMISGKVLKETVTERSVDNKASAEGIIDRWSEAVKNVLKMIPGDHVRGVGFAMPGPFDYVKGISYIKGVAKYENLYGVNVTGAMTSKLGASAGLQVRYMNDASAFAVGEAWAGSAAGYARSLSVTFGTGFGSAFISDRIPVVDGPQVPKLGCIYHIPYRDGIADDYFSTRGLLGRYKKLSGKDLPGVKELAALAAHDSQVMDLFADFGEKAGQFLSYYLKNFGAEILVVGGNISHAYKLFGKVFEESLKKEGCNCEVALSELKEDAALIGSAYLFDEDFWRSVQHALPLM